MWFEMFLKVQTIKKELSLLFFNMKKDLGAFHQASFSQNRRTVGVGRDCWRSSRPNLFNPPMSIRQIAVTVKPNKAKLQASRE